jgi:hypothetical protein
MSGKNVNDIKIPKKMTIEDFVYDSDKNGKIAKGKFKNTYLFFNKQQH